MESPSYSHHTPREEGQSRFPIVSIFLTIPLDFTILYLDKLRKKVAHHGILLFLHLRYCKDFLGALKHLIDKNKGISSPSR